ncbi:hypothetical protein BDP27DRAFT_424498 [Rhodocollybia butyracea]|uniref:Uncharacterized protein n=1 Tax=Rhodocollybia butyracea TaxID=206335 RepID=A0A9P5U9Q5_9AGAR|nr:hypothetical protein BDP27DRAFT_424498 [Rhodocollybia butyracea]
MEASALFHHARAPAGPHFTHKLFIRSPIVSQSKDVDHFAEHTRAGGKGVQSLRAIFGHVTEAGICQYLQSCSKVSSSLSLVRHTPWPFFTVIRHSSSTSQRAHDNR